MSNLWSRVYVARGLVGLVKFAGLSLLAWNHF